MILLARTPLPCRYESCALPSTHRIPTIGDIQSSQIQLYPSVIWNGCETIYAKCPPRFKFIMTYNSFTKDVRVYNTSIATAYCGNYQNYYILATNGGSVENYAVYGEDLLMQLEMDRSTKKMCPNTFDVINCIGLYERYLLFQLWVSHLPRIKKWLWVVFAD